MGSVKDLRIIEQPTSERPGIGQFYFSDRYSVFDWGEMPDHIESKGKALCTMGAYFFEKLGEMDIRTHYQGLIEDGKLKKLSDLKRPADTMQVSLVKVLRPGEKGGNYDYTAYKQPHPNILIPLEVIYRNSLPEGSSIFRRLAKGPLKLEDIGLDHMPGPNETLDKPILDVSTKLEITDRYLSWKEAQEISGLSDSELHDLKETTLRINDLITRHVSMAGMVNEDGKVEFGFDADRRLMLVDILGTPDECRFTYANLPVSKEVARKYYRNTDWYAGVERAKEEDRTNWKNLVTTPPPKLPERLHILIAQLYQGVCNEITHREWFRIPPLKQILQEIKEQIIT
jgi:phosphoribosylaminoimidazole-succinocarboxamide synthase